MERPGLQSCGLRCFVSPYIFTRIHTKKTGMYQNSVLGSGGFNGDVRSGGSRISGEREILRGRQPPICPIFPENCMKMQKFWPRGGACSLCPLDPPLVPLPVKIFSISYMFFGEIFAKFCVWSPVRRILDLLLF